MKPSRIRNLAWIASALVLGSSVPLTSFGQSSAARDLTQVSLEDLSNIRVTSVSKKEEKLARAPAAIFVITQEDIRRSGLNSIPEILRMAPGLDVAQIGGNKWAISSRGFNSQFSDKLLVLIDGRSVYLASDSGVFWDEQDTLLEDIDRIEVIRGPGATLWGANAVNGVINIVTKPATETQGGLVTSTTGNEDHTVTGVRYGGQAGNTGAYRVYSKYSRRADLASGSDNSRSADSATMRGGFRTDWNLSERDALTVQGDLFHETSGLDLTIPILTAPFQRAYTATERSGGGNLVMNFSHRSSDRSVYTVMGYFDHGEKDNTLYGEKNSTINLEFQHSWRFSPRNEIVWGFGFRYGASSFVSSPTLSCLNRNEHLYSAFVQDEYHLVPEKWSLIAGTKVEHNDFTGVEVQPDIRLLWTPTPRTALWAAVSRAVHTPSYFDENGTFALATFPGSGGLPNLLEMAGKSQATAETLRAHEIGYRTQLSQHFSVDWTGFFAVYRHLRTFEPAEPFLASDPQPVHLVLPLVIENRMHGRSEGLEITATWEITERWRINAAYSWLSLQLHLDPSSKDTSSETAERQSPQHQLQFRSLLEISRKVQFDANLYHIAALPAFAVPAYTRIDARLGWRPFAPFELSLGGRNLQGGLHLEFISEGPFDPDRVGRSIYIQGTWRF
jgi:iron complex outermembrane receptor protein